MANDLRTPIAIARDKWLLSEEGKRALDGSATGQYLENRLVLAFLAGWNAHGEASRPLVEAVLAIGVEGGPFDEFWSDPVNRRYAIETIQYEARKLGDK